MTPPTVSLVFLVFNRREELRTSLRRMLRESDYPPDRVEAIVVDNASEDGSAEMVAREFPEVRVVRRSENSGVSAFNDGFALARGDWVLALDDDCYLPPNGLARAVAEAVERDADLVSFAVESTYDPSHRFDLVYRTGLLSFWGCAVLIRREALAALGGYDPAIFVWANELELTLRLYDRGYRHLHLPEVVAVHQKRPSDVAEYVRGPTYRFNMRNFAYVAAKLLHPRDTAGVVASLLVVIVRDALTVDPVALGAAPELARGVARGLRRRRPVRPEISRFYRLNFESFASPWRMSRSPAEIARALPREVVRAATGRGDEVELASPPRREAWYAERADLYPASAATLEF